MRYGQVGTRVAVSVVTEKTWELTSNLPIDYTVRQMLGGHLPMRGDR